MQAGARSIKLKNMVLPQNLWVIFQVSPATEEVA
jgi:hypothetical protein